MSEARTMNDQQPSHPLTGDTHPLPAQTPATSFPNVRPGWNPYQCAVEYHVDAGGQQVWLGEFSTVDPDRVVWHARLASGWETLVKQGPIICDGVAVAAAEFVAFVEICQSQESA